MSDRAMDTLYEESLLRYRVRRYVALSLGIGSTLALAGLLAAIVLDYLIGFPEVGARSLSIQSWLVIAAIGGGGTAVFLSSSIAEAQVTRRASVNLETIVPGRGGRTPWPNLIFGRPKVPARIDLRSVKRFTLKTYDPERTFPTYRWYRFWRAEFELANGDKVPLDSSVSGLFHPLALQALIDLASYLKARGLEVEVRQSGKFHIWKHLDKASE